MNNVQRVVAAHRRSNSQRASAIAPTQREAIERARELTSVTLSHGNARSHCNDFGINSMNYCGISRSVELEVRLGPTDAVNWKCALLCA
ncbi:DUF2188 domain-containing protein [Burkholderia lata]|uniref:DUF2188 domain-containing protein n=1 Tax=Burkholderia lata (strain ATCC 17760 / DSM 23089 / LMG 22485 / NCIMB 9086 / R18194 / 383) TaxID=482957 RepID=UPI0012EA0FF5